MYMNTFSLPRLYNFRHWLTDVNKQSYNANMSYNKTTISENEKKNVESDVALYGFGQAKFAHGGLFLG